MTVNPDVDGYIKTRPVTKGTQGGRIPPRYFSPHLEKCVGHRLKLLDIVQKCWAPLRKLRPSWCPKLVTSMI